MSSMTRWVYLSILTRSRVSRWGKTRNNRLSGSWKSKQTSKPRGGWAGRGEHWKSPREGAAVNVVQLADRQCALRRKQVPAPYRGRTSHQLSWWSWLFPQHLGGRIHPAFSFAVRWLIFRALCCKIGVKVVESGRLTQEIPTKWEIRIVRRWV